MEIEVRRASASDFRRLREIRGGEHPIERSPPDLAVETLFSNGSRPHRDVVERRSVSFDNPRQSRLSRLFSDSRRFQYVSMNLVDSRGSEGIRVDLKIADNLRSVSSCDHNLRPVS
jgi:hypothetical protein